MNLSGRIDRLEKVIPPPRQNICFVPLGVAWTDAEPAWIQAECDRRGLSESDLIVVKWEKPE